MRSKQAGNAILIILIAVFLFGALAAAFMRGSRTGQTNLTAGQTRLLAQELLSYAQTLERASIKLIQRGCAPSQLSYVGLSGDCNTNPVAPTDNSCDVLHSNGGMISTIDLSTSLPGLSIRVSGGTSMQNIGTWDSSDAERHQDMVIWFADIPLALCEEMDRMAGNSGAVPNIADLDASCFGAAGYGSSVALLGTRAGMKAGCINTTTAPSLPANLPSGPSFYYVIHEQ